METRMIVLEGRVVFNNTSSKSCAARRMDSKSSTKRLMATQDMSKGSTSQGTS